MRSVRVSGEGISTVAVAGTSAAVGRAKRTSALDRSAEMGGSKEQRMEVPFDQGGVGVGVVVSRRRSQ